MESIPEFRRYTSQKQNLVKLEQLNWALAMLFKKTSVHCGVVGPAALGLGDTECLLFIHAPCINKQPFKLTLPDPVMMRKCCFLNEKETKHGSKFYCPRGGARTMSRFSSATKQFVWLGWFSLLDAILTTVTGVVTLRAKLALIQSICFTLLQVCTEVKHTKAQIVTLTRATFVVPKHQLFCETQ